MITARIVGDSAVLLELKSIGLRITDRLRTAVKRSAIMLTGYVKSDKLSGQVLHNRTGTLRRKINYVVTETDTSIIGSVGVQLEYAAAHEYGLDKVESIREHLRQTKSGFVTVSAHTRHMVLPERSFLRSALADKAPTIRDTLREAVLGAIAA